MVIRQLSEEEKSASLRVRDKMVIELEYNRYLKAYAQLMLDNGLEQNYLKQRREYEQKFKDSENAFVGAYEAIKIIDDQVENGVEVKDGEIIDESEVEE